MRDSWDRQDEEGKETFLVQIYFQQNDTWQGSIRWMDQKKTQKFRSTLEMIRLMDEALSKSGGTHKWSTEEAQDK